MSKSKQMRVEEMPAKRHARHHDLRVEGTEMSDMKDYQGWKGAGAAKPPKPRTKKYAR